MEHCSCRDVIVSVVVFVGVGVGVDAPVHCSDAIDSGIDSATALTLFDGSSTLQGMRVPPRTIMHARIISAETGGCSSSR